jgi:hypothetical protein
MVSYGLLNNFILLFPVNDIRGPIYIYIYESFNLPLGYKLI